MSLVIATNKDQDNTFRQEQSIYSAWSFKNSLSSTYNIPADSQVALQSCKVNLDGRITISANNSWWYDYFGEDLDTVDGNDKDGNDTDTTQLELTTSYPILQDLNVPKGEFRELSTEEFSDAIEDNHRCYHPNLMDKFTCDVQRNAGLDFLGYEFTYDQETTTQSTMPTGSQAFFKDSFQRGVYDKASGVFTRTLDLYNGTAGAYPDPCVRILTGTPLSLCTGKMKVNFDNANASGVPWGIGLSRDCPNPYITEDFETFAPMYFNVLNGNDESEAMNCGTNNNADYFEDFGVHRNASGELVLRHAVPSGDGDEELIYREVKYWTNTSSALKGGGRYDLSTNANGYDGIAFTCIGEDVQVYGFQTGKPNELITKYVSGQPKDSYFKPIAQTCWCLHPVLFVGGIGAGANNNMTLSEFSGMNLDDYNSRVLNKGGWFETASLLSNLANFNAINRCRQVDNRRILDPKETLAPFDYAINNTLTAIGSGIDNKYVMILKPSIDYEPTWGASCSDLFGFPGRSVVIDGTGTFPQIKFVSDKAPELTSMLSVFVRLNGFGQQVMNARTGNKSTILSHLPTADSRMTTGSSQRIFYEPKNLIWLDLKNPYDMKVSEFNIDFVYSNEQYAKILQGQSIVVLYFRTKEGGEIGMKVME